MNNEDAMKFFENMSIKAKDNPQCVKMKSQDLSEYDADFILKYANKDSQILDLGTGTGLIVNRIYDKVKSIDCVELLEGLYRHITKADNIKILPVSMFDFETDNKYDLITIFGTMHYFNQNEAIEIYKKYIDMLKPSGKIIIKNQFGVSEDVVVSGFSQEQQTNYYAQYRYINNEITTLEKIGYKNVQKFDIYPDSANRWENTHFWAIVAGK